MDKKYIIAALMIIVIIIVITLYIRNKDVDSDSDSDSDSEDDTSTDIEPRYAHAIDSVYEYTTSPKREQFFVLVSKSNPSVFLHTSAGPDIDGVYTVHASQLTVEQRKADNVMWSRTNDSLDSPMGNLTVSPDGYIVASEVLPMSIEWGLDSIIEFEGHEFVAVESNVAVVFEDKTMDISEVGPIIAMRMQVLQDMFGGEDMCVQQ